MTKAVIFGLAGTFLTQEEFEFFSRTQPVGFILFKRNIQNPEQVKKLCTDLKNCLNNSNTPILIDQEGGRVQRLSSPYWPSLSPAKKYGTLYDNGKKEEAIYQLQEHARTIAKTLTDLGINMDCWPCLDVATPQVSTALGDRLFSQNSHTTYALAQQAIDTLLQNHIMPVIKHFIGYGKATCDPHKCLPVVEATLKDLEDDFYPFRQIHQPVWGMTAHVLYRVLDEKNPATISPTIISFIRQNIGFNGFLITDDISMGALSSDVKSVSIKSLQAGCDAVLHCNGNLQEMKELVSVLPDLTKQAQNRLNASWELLHDH